MASDTSSDLNKNLLTNKEINPVVLPIKKETTETDLYLGLVANPSKILVDSPKSSSSLHYNNDDDSSNTSDNNDKKHRSDSSRSSDSFKIPVHSNTKSSKKSARESSESSRAKYEKISITPNSDSAPYTSKKTEVKPPPPPPELTPQQLRMKRIELLRKLSDIKSKGYKLSKEYDFTSSIEEMEYEYDLLKSFAERRNGIKLYKNTILNISNIAEFFNNKYDPFGIKLDGWSEHMNVEIDSYDDVMEELYEKYKSSGKSMPPELKLFMLIVASASAFHFSKSYLTKMPGFDGIMNMQPELISKIVNNNQSSQFMTEQELNIERQRKEMQERDKQMKQQMRQPPNQFNNSQEHMFEQQRQQQQQQQFSQPQQQANRQPLPQSSQQANRQPASQQFQNQNAEFQQSMARPNNIKPPQSENFQTFHKAVNFATPIGTPSQLIQSNDPRNILQKKPGIKSPDSVKDILSRLHSRENDTVDTQDETSSVNNDRIVSDTLSESSSKSKNGKKKKQLMEIF
jgi:hypothetical protein